MSNNDPSNNPGCVSVLNDLAKAFFSLGCLIIILTFLFILFSGVLLAV